MMNSPSKLKLRLAVAALALGGASAAGIATQTLSSTAVATPAANAKKAASEAKKARKALAKRQAERAVAHAEAAVANDPARAEYRALLGQAYMLAGRFASASEALGDALSLNPEDGTVALNLSLAQIAQGNWAGARATLQTNADLIAASDRGLAFALAGDPVTAVEILTPAVREPDATAKTRQNLALSLALAGRWKEASDIAAMDVAPDKLQARLTEWAAFARPNNAYDQVASLLGVTPVEDAGQPVALALARQPNLAVAAAPVEPAESVDQYMPGVTAEPAAVAAAAPVEMPAEALPEPQQVAGTGPQVVFGPRAEIVQAIPASYRRTPAPAPARVAAREKPAAAVAPAAAPERKALASGSFYVQLGAYENAGVARDAWARYTRQVPVLGDTQPHAAHVSTRAGKFYRLSVGGFARADADGLCRRVKASGGRCFVRTGAGDAVAAWFKPGSAQVAAR